MPDSTPVCRRCGRCCELGGPGLLRDDAPLLSSGALRPEMLVCLRRGQWADRKSTRLNSSHPK